MRISRGLYKMDHVRVPGARMARARENVDAKNRREKMSQQNLSLDFETDNCDFVY